MGECVHKFVNDLGIAAYLLMHGYEVIGKKGRSIYFECENEEEALGFDNIMLEYQPPDNEFYNFDSCLMYLKKINDFEPKQEINKDIHKVISDLGAAAYLLMREYDKDSRLKLKVIGKRGKYVYFEHPEGVGSEVDRRAYKYLPSQFKVYDSNLMALKGIGEYIPGSEFGIK